MTVYRYVRTGRLPAERDGARWTVDPADLDRMRRPAPYPGEPLRAIRGLRQAREPDGGRRRSRSVEHGRGRAGLLTRAGRDLPRAARAGAARHRNRLGERQPQHRRRARCHRGRATDHRAARPPVRRAAASAAPSSSVPHPATSTASRVRSSPTCSATARFVALDLGANVPAASFLDAARDANRLVAVMIAVTTPGHDLERCAPASAPSEPAASRRPSSSEAAPS